MYSLLLLILLSIFSINVNATGVNGQAVINSSPDVSTILNQAYNRGISASSTRKLSAQQNSIYKIYSNKFSNLSSKQRSLKNNVKAHCISVHNEAGCYSSVSKLQQVNKEIIKLKSQLYNEIGVIKPARQGHLDSSGYRHSTNNPNYDFFDLF